MRRKTLAADTAAQGFRSAPGLNAGVLPQMAQAGPAAWANDFQQQNYINPRSQSQHPATGWHQEFTQQQMPQAGPAYAPQSGYNAPLERLSTLAAMPRAFQPMYGGQMPMNQNFQPQQQIQPQSTNEEVFDEAAFARAFDEAALGEMASTQSVAQQEEVMLNESAERLIGTDNVEPQTRLGADLIHDPDGKPNQHVEAQQDPDALARTAAELLDRVKENRSEKFQNSQFLQLMRQLRDKEVIVKGEHIVSVGTDGDSARAAAP
jgi:hypothetical protein